MKIYRKQFDCYYIQTKLFNHIVHTEYDDFKLTPMRIGISYTINKLLKKKILSPIYDNQTIIGC